MKHFLFFGYSSTLWYCDIAVKLIYGESLVLFNCLKLVYDSVYYKRVRDKGTKTEEMTFRFNLLICKRKKEE